MKKVVKWCYIIKLNDISNELGLGNVYKSRIHSEKYTLDYIRWR